jgi:uncharacterized membrane protein
MPERADPAIPKIAPILFRSVIISSIVTILALAPSLSKGPGAFVGRLARPPHLPNLSLLAQASLAVQVHLTFVALAVVIGGVQLARPKGDKTHRLLGSIWFGFIMATAVSALFIHVPVGLPNIAGVGLLHIFSAIVLVFAPLAVIAARRGALRRHASIMSGLYIGGLGVAGLFAFLPGRLLWRIFFG